jgi:ABC-2 type transport system ATP-binding protein
VSGEIAAELRGARVTFGAITALDDLSLTVRRGEMFGIIGPDGAGKSTAIRALLGLVPLDSGTALVLGQDPVAGGRSLRSAVGYLSQRFTLYGDLTVQENLDFFGEIHRVRDLRARRARLLAFTRLEGFRHRRASALSGGMQKKLALACTLVHTPQVLFLDEPTTGVDPPSRREMWALLASLLAGGMSILVTTPYLDEAERCGRVALVRAGRILVVGSPPELRAWDGTKLLEIVCEPVRDACRRLAASPRVLEVQPFGDRLHVVPRSPGDDLADLLARLDGIAIASARFVDPSLEDVFIWRVAGHARGPT